MRGRIAALTLGTCVLLGGPALATYYDEDPPAPDNTKQNQATGMTAGDQGMSAADTELARKIRAAVVKDKSLSTYAHNVKIIAQNGKVTLKGPVRSESERATIETKATEIAGAGNVTNELTIATQ